MLDQIHLVAGVAFATHTPEPIAMWRITAQAAWALLWFWAAFWLFRADIAPFVQWLFMGFALPYGTFSGLQAYRALRKRQAVLRRKQCPHTTPKFSLIFSASPTQGLVVYILLSLLGVYWSITFLLSLDSGYKLSALPIFLAAFSALMYFSVTFLSAKKCVYRAQSNTFALYKRSQYLLSWELEAEYPLNDFIGIQRENTENGEKIWFIGKEQNVLLGTAHSLRAGSYMRDAIADIYAATGLPELVAQNKR
ncbi:hypothetical protein ACKLNO_01985 [Neisseriaceae bacterium B1]